MEINKNIFDIFDSTEMRYNKIFYYFEKIEGKKGRNLDKRKYKIACNHV